MDATLSHTDLPLYVDLDGTLVKTDVAQELLLQVAARPKMWPQIALSLVKGRAIGLIIITIGLVVMAKA